MQLYILESQLQLKKEVPAFMRKNDQYSMGRVYCLQLHDMVLNSDDALGVTKNSPKVHANSFELNVGSPESYVTQPSHRLTQ